MNDTIVLKFGGSSVADNERLKVVADKIINMYNKNNNIVVILSAQGKMTDKLISEAKELSKDVEKREMDALVSCGEQMSAAKLSILLNSLGYKAISLTGWQAGIYTNNTNENAIKYYRKNYTTSSERNENKYYSASLTNLALIYMDMENYKEAIDFLKLALLYDSEVNDYENMYFSQKELAKLYAKSDEITAIGYFKQALSSAQKLNDSFKTALVYFEAGEFHYDRGNDEKALVNFLCAKEALKNTSDNENISRVNQRIKDIKIRLDSITYNSIMEKYDK